MTRQTEAHTIVFQTPGMEVGSSSTRLVPRPTKVMVWASQMGRGVVVQIPSPMVIADRTMWEELKQLVEKAFRDDENIPIQDNKMRK